jgi:hypothetical protein
VNAACQLDLFAAPTPPAMDRLGSGSSTADEGAKPEPSESGRLEAELEVARTAAAATGARLADVFEARAHCHELWAELHPELAETCHREAAGWRRLGAGAGDGRVAREEPARPDGSQPRVMVGRLREDGTRDVAVWRWLEDGGGWYRDAGRAVAEAEVDEEAQALGVRTPGAVVFWGPAWPAGAVA